MSADDTTDSGDGSTDGGEDRTPSTEGDDESETVDDPDQHPPAESDDDRSRRDEITERLSEETDRAVEEFDQRLVDLLSWMLDTETRARIYVHLRQSPYGTSDEIADGTGLYPSTVREALAELHDDEIVERRKRESEGAGNNPYEYAAIAPSELVGTVAERVQGELNTVFNLDSHIRSGDDQPEPEDDPVTITVEDERAGEDDEDADTAADAGTESSSDPATDDHDATDD
ncbi:hypothetical protein GCM10028857_16240 [Salinarchaeum chitinilyticum]